ncbi:MAG: hypothetical protein GY757_50240 [bacterium]|nr:hypothetical protein [bacterium]
MEIILFTEAEGLLDYLRTGDQGTVSVLDYTGSKEIKEAAGEYIEPRHVFTAQTKERLMDEYVEAISELGAHNNYSIPWLCHPISEKNDLEPDNLFEQLIDYTAFCQIVTGIKKKKLAVFLQNVHLFKNIKGYLETSKIAYGITGSEPGKRNFVRTLGSPVKKSYMLLRGVLTAQVNFMKTRFPWKAIDKTATYTVIRTWFDSRSIPLMEKGRDVYFGKFPGYLKEKGHNPLYFGEFVDGFHHEIKNYPIKGGQPIMFGRTLINGLDYLKSIVFRKTLKGKIKIQTGIRVLDINVDHVFSNYYRHHLPNLHIQTNYLTYRAAVKLVGKIKIHRFYMPFENYAWEKLTRLAIAESSGSTRVYSFQHAQVALNAAKFFPGKKESRAAFWPDTIFTLGKITRDFLVEKKNYPSEKITAACALRHDYVFSDRQEPRKRNKRILVQLWSFGKSVQLLNFLEAAGLRNGASDYEITVNPHPCHPMKKIIPHLDSPYDNNYHEAEGGLAETFKAHDLVIYHGTTTSLDALANGLPVIDVEFDDFITVDPLFEFHEFKWTEGKPGELMGVIEKIYALSDEQFYQKQQKGFQFVKNYFYPVNESNIKKMLPEG